MRKMILLAVFVSMPAIAYGQGSYDAMKACDGIKPPEAWRRCLNEYDRRAQDQRTRDEQQRRDDVSGDQGQQPQGGLNCRRNPVTGAVNCQPN